MTVHVTRDLIATLAATWGVIMALAPLLQLRRMRHRGSADDVSLAYLAVLLPGFLLWVMHGYLAEDVALMVPNAVAFLTGAVTATVAARMRRRTSISRRT